MSPRPRRLVDVHGGEPLRRIESGGRLVRAPRPEGSRPFDGSCTPAATTPDGVGTTACSACGIIVSGCMGRTDARRNAMDTEHSYYARVWMRSSVCSRSGLVAGYWY